MTGRVVAVNVGTARAADYCTLGRTAIDKRPADGPVPLDELGFTTDTQVDKPDHGGIHQAVYAYSTADAEFWAAEVGRPIPPGAFGENLTIADLDVSAAVAGERWRLGEVELQVTSPRIPCRTFAGFWGVPDLVKRFTAAARPGAYLRVNAAGTVAAGVPVEVIDRPDHGVTVADLLRARAGDRSTLDRLRAAAADLPPAWAAWVEKVAAGPRRP